MSYYNVLLMLKSGLLICTHRVTHITDPRWKVWLQYKGVGMSILQKPTIFMLLMLYLSTTFINFHRAVQYYLQSTLPSQFAVTTATRPGSDEWWICQEGNRAECASLKVWSHRWQNHIQKSRWRFVHSKCGLNEKKAQIRKKKHNVQ